uniref:Uncharacterized protein n=1 Tax=Cucumis melo TaxID=3656 RepID=A0A9I9E3M7_CUCME
ARDGCRHDAACVATPRRAGLDSSGAAGRVVRLLLRLAPERLCLNWR